VASEGGGVGVGDILWRESALIIPSLLFGYQPSLRCVLLSRLLLASIDRALSTVLLQSADTWVAPHIAGPLPLVLC
jgi:hypothetical protein